ncbi:MAG: prolyl oligopeptidase family serine peptidase [Candidatus Riflebacteria bacterium]|jgi:prolyl oligopeptidase|nr:prolyl oligopeptidase family serine peptidase [Candidatus Riflebacteria bacterium]
MSSASTRYPISRIASETDNYHGTLISDDYRWLEGDQNGDSTPEVDSWTDEQNALTRKVIDGLPGRESLKARLKLLIEEDSCWLPVFAGSKLFFAKRPGKANQPLVYMVEGEGPEKLLLDPESMDATGLVSIGWFEPSPDGKLLAYGSSTAGDENHALKVLRVADLAHLADHITNKVVGTFWLPDNSGFIYSRLADPDNPYSREIRLHKLGEECCFDRLIFSQYKEGPLATTWGPSARLSEDGHWLILSYHTSTRSNDLWLVDFAEWLKTGNLERRDIIVGRSSSSCARVVHNRLYILTNENAPNSRVLVAPLSSPDQPNWHVFVPEDPSAAIEDWGFTADSLLLSYKKNAASAVHAVFLASGAVTEVALPGIGSASFASTPARPDFFLDYTSFDCPNQILHYAAPALSPVVWWKRAVPFDLSTMRVSQHWFASKDGTRVSMFLLHRKGLEKNGANPTLVYGYGGFGISMMPAYSGAVLPWIEDGGIYAVVNLRGGGEYGDEWHKMGMLGSKEKVFEDLEAAAEWLIASGYTTSERLAVSGRSNGGLLVGAAITRRPDLYRAAICGVPLLDMLRYQSFLMARYWVPEYGTAENAEDFAWLRRYSPYHNIVKDRHYPAIFIHTAEKDTRVHPMHARKMTAALQNATASSFEKPVLLWVERQAGHGMGKPLAQILEEQTDQWSFLRWQLGLDR